MVTYKRHASVIGPGVNYSDYKIDNYYIIYIFYSAPGYINILYDDCIAYFGYTVRIYLRTQMLALLRDYPFNTIQPYYCRSWLCDNGQAFELADVASHFMDRIKHHNSVTYCYH